MLSIRHVNFVDKVIPKRKKWKVCAKNLVESRGHRTDTRRARHGVGEQIGNAPATRREGAEAALGHALGHR